MKKIIIRSALVLGIIGIAAAAYIYQFVINKPHPDYEMMEPQYILLANDLFEKYRTDRQGAEEKFNGKVVQLNGTFDRIEQIDSLLVGVFIFDEGMFGEEGVRCTMLGSQHGHLDATQAGKEIRVKGYVTGYNDTDVIMEQCSMVSKKQEL